MSGLISINPIQQGSAGIRYHDRLSGYIQGDPVDNLNLLQQFLESGKVAATETMKMWAGTAIKETLEISTAAHFGNTIARATSIANITGFTVSSEQIQRITPPGQAPIVTPGMTMGFARLGTGLKIPFPVDPALISSLSGDKIDMTETEVTIDFDVTSATYGHIIAKGGGTSLATKGIKFWRIGYENSWTVIRGAAGNWDVVDSFVWDKTSSVIVLEI